MKESNFSQTIYKNKSDRIKDLIYQGKGLMIMPQLVESLTRSLVKISITLHKIFLPRSNGYTHTLINKKDIKKLSHIKITNTSTWPLVVYLDQYQGLISLNNLPLRIIHKS